MNLYCIKHGRMEKAEEDKLLQKEGFVFVHEDIKAEYDRNGEPCGQYMDWCEFNQGWATCPPPAFDLQDYIERVGPPPIWIDFLPYEYNVERDELVEILP